MTARTMFVVLCDDPDAHGTFVALYKTEKLAKERAEEESVHAPYFVSYYVEEAEIETKVTHTKPKKRPAIPPGGGANVRIVGITDSALLGD